MGPGQSSYEYSIPKSGVAGGQSKLTTKFDLYKYQKTGMTKLRVESMAR